MEHKRFDELIAQVRERGFDGGAKFSLPTGAGTIFETCAEMLQIAIDREDWTLVAEVFLIQRNRSKLSGTTHEEFLDSSSRRFVPWRETEGFDVTTGKYSPKSANL